MFITRKLDYGLRILLILGCRPHERLTSVALSKLINAPRQFTLKIAQTLTQAGLIKAQRGVGGGIQLARQPETITLIEIFEVMDTSSALNECLVNPHACIREEYCSVHHRLRSIQAVLDQELTKTTLAGLISNQKILDRQRKEKP